MEAFHDLHTAFKKEASKLALPAADGTVDNLQWRFNKRVKVGAVHAVYAVDRRKPLQSWPR